MNPTSTTENKEFSAPRHWLGPEELEASYWADAKTMERRGQEFHDKPIETIAMIDKMDTQGLARRDFLTIMGASMAMASFACARRPVNKIIPYVVKPEDVTAGIATWYASVYPETGEGLLIRNREGRPIKLEGNPDHVLTSNGALSMRAQAALLDLYDPDRLKSPLLRGKGSSSKETSWEDADKAVAAKLKGAKSVRLLSTPVRGQTSLKLTQEFLAAFPSGALVEFDPMAMDEVADAQELSYGAAVLPRYRFAEADVVVSLGADFLGTWDLSTYYSQEWARGRKLDFRSKNGRSGMSKLFAFESMMTLTGANADERLPIRPGDELKVALAIANEIIVGQKQSRYAGDLQVVSVLGGYKADAIAEEIGIEGGAERIKKAAQALWAARGRGLVVAGGPNTKTRDSVALQVVINLLNSALENDGVTVDGTSNPQNWRPAGFAGLSKLIGEMKSGAVDVLIVRGTNPVFTVPKALGFEDAIKKVPFVVYAGSMDNETAQFADYVLPEHHFLENWGDSEAIRGVRGIQQPAIAPIHDSRAFEDMMLGWVKAGSLSAGALAAKMAVATGDESGWYGYLRSSWSSAGMGSVDAWESLLRTGVNGSKELGGGSARGFRPAALDIVPKYAASAKDDVSLVLYSSQAMREGDSANNAWLQEFPDPVTKVCWDNFAAIGPGLAKKKDLKNDDVVEIVIDGARAELPVVVQPGMHDGAIAIAVGYGRSLSGKVGTGAGVDVFPMVRAEKGRMIFSGQKVEALRKTGKLYRLATTQWHNASENRPIINDITLADYKESPNAANHTNPHLRMKEVPTIWPTHEYKGYRWAMAIDLNSCTGCGACAIACQAENNIPVVGRQNVRVSRQMHWIRIDRYYSGTPENPQVLFQPMLCQHCENAPCETVCPVLATVHNDEGLNEQTYNRCVGTRYCQNNCPYKVRRFNFFDHWKSYEGTMNLVWNPEVTVRTRGIMEKCTFCVQRIRDAKDKAKDEGRKVHDGEFKTACQQTCPTEAIVFGDINDPNSAVSKLSNDPRGFRVLEILNTKPSITYLTKVRNTDVVYSHGPHDAKHGEGHEASEVKHVAPEGAHSEEKGAEHGAH